ncbi:MAG: hypothetical protein FWE14_10130 [Lachnospiraceae bacterium]|nr:hypothetical protein [Lachnospiraceae bacterium]
MENKVKALVQELVKQIDLSDKTPEEKFKFCNDIINEFENLKKKFETPGKITALGYGRRLF